MKSAQARRLIYFLHTLVSVTVELCHKVVVSCKVVVSVHVVVTVVGLVTVLVHVDVTVAVTVSLLQDEQSGYP